VSRPVPPPAAAGSRVTIELPGEVNGIMWNAKSHTLFLADSTNQAIDRWTDQGGVERALALPHEDKLELGGLVQLADGTFVTTSFGFGKDGAVLHVLGDGKVTRVPGLDSARRRIGLTLAPDGTVYDAWFTAANGSHSGGVSRIDLEQGEHDLAIANLGKAVGVAASSTTLYVSDQDHGSILAVSLAAPQTTTAVTSGMTSADLLTLLPSGDLVTGGRTGTVYRVTTGGKASELATGFEQVRGTAYDPERKRLFVVEHSKAGPPRLHVLSVEP
jgi:sugar lactone lactonase YvrE